MNYIKQSIWAFAAIALVACSSDDDKDTTESLTPVENTATSFSASIESGISGSSKATRTTLKTNDGDSPYPVWAENDQLHVYNATTPSDGLFSMKSTEYVGQRQGVFEGTITRNTGDKFFALYCSTLTGDGAPTLTASNSTATISATIPSALMNYTAGFHPEYHFMTACTTGNAFKFKNAISLIRISITENTIPGKQYQNFVIRRIRFKSNVSTENIAGKFTATIGDNGSIGTPTITSGGSSEIVIGDGTTALAEGDYYIPVLPCTLTQGFTLAFEDDDDYTRANHKVYDRIRDSKFTIGASEIIDLGSYTARECAKEAYVDLGLTNSAGKKVLWCIENVYDEGNDALPNLNNGQYFYSWGETLEKAHQGKTGENATYSWYRSSTSGENNRSYKYGYSGANNSYYFSDGTLTKYTSDSATELETSDDAAYVKSNGRLRIPSAEDYTIMFNAINNSKTLTLERANSSARGGVIYRVVASNGNFVVFNGYGFRHKESSNDNGIKQEEDGCYWTRSRSTTGNIEYATGAWFDFTQSGNKLFPSITQVNRCQGRMIRAVIYR